MFLILVKKTRKKIAILLRKSFSRGLVGKKISKKYYFFIQIGRKSKKQDFCRLRDTNDTNDKDLPADIGNRSFVSGGRGRERFDMKTKKVVFLISWVLVLGGWPSAGYSTVKSPDGVVTFYGILCGISTYKDSSMNVEYSAKDAQDLKAALLKSYNWKDGNITLLLNSGVTGQAIYNAIVEVAQKADPDDMVLFYFSGHGSKVPDAAPFDEADGQDETLIDYNGNYIRDDTLSDWFKELPTSKYVVFLDTCFSGGQIKGILSGPGLAGSFSDAGDGFGADFFTSQIQTDLDDLKHGVVVTACDSDELAGETSALENGIFTHFLLQSFSRVGDRNQNNWVSAEECFQYASSLVTAEEAGQHVQIYDGNTQSELEFYELVDTGGNLGGDATEALKVVRTTPEANGKVTDSSLSTIEVEFNKTFQQGPSFDLISVKDANGQLIGLTAAISNVVLQITLQTPLADLGAYTVTVPAGAVSDVKGNGLEGGYVFTFTRAALSDKPAGNNVSGGGCSEIGWPVIMLILWMGWSGVRIRR